MTTQLNKQIQLTRAGLSDFITISKYARHIESESRFETPDEITQRSLDMHLRRYTNAPAEFRYNLQIAFDHVFAGRVLTSMRCAQFAGEAIERQNNRMFNCCYTPVDRLAAFSEIFYNLLCGCGVGYSVQVEHVSELPRISKFERKSAADRQLFVVPDTIEGWADAVHRLIENAVRGIDTYFDYSLIRLKGAPLKVAGGKAPGPAPLRKALIAIREVLLTRQGSKLLPINVFDICCHLAEAVMSGGIRRSATICLFSPEDDAMMQAKLPHNFEWTGKNKHRSQANISAAMSRHERNKPWFEKVMNLSSEFYGEPGFFFRDKLEHGTNPCFHPDTEILTIHGYRRIKELYETGAPVHLIVDYRFSPRTVETASPVKLTQRNAETYKVTLSDGKSVCTTLNHEFETARGRLQLADVTCGDTLYVESEGALAVDGIATVVSIEPHEVTDVYCLKNPHSATVIANGIVTGNCAEIGLNSTESRSHASGFGFCNLTEVVVPACRNEEQFVQSCMAAAVIGTAQAGYTDFTYIGEASSRIARSEALLGVSLTGMHDRPDIAFDPDVLHRATDGVFRHNKINANYIGLPGAARATCIKPSGTASLKVGCVGSGIHPHHARRYFRRVTVSPLEPAVQEFARVNPHMVDGLIEGLVSESSGQWQIVFPIEAPPEARTTVKEQSAEEFITDCMSVYKHWVEPGTFRPDSSPGLTHSVSATCTVRPDERETVKKLLWRNRDSIAAMSFVPHSFDKLDQGAPREEVVTEHDHERFGYLAEHYRPVDWAGWRTDDGGDMRGQEPACAGGACER